MKPNKLNELLAEKEGNYIFPFLWLHGEDYQKIADEIGAIYSSGIRALCVESRPFEKFCETEWWDTLSFILAECAART